MMGLDENALICDLAETYGILDYTRVPVQTLGILCSGLRADARIVQKMMGINADMKSILLARIFDGVQLMLWSRTKNPTEANRPRSIAETMFQKEQKYEGYNTGADFMKARAEMLKGK